MKREKSSARGTVLYLIKVTILLSQLAFEKVTRTELKTRLVYSLYSLSHSHKSFIFLSHIDLFYFLPHFIAPKTEKNQYMKH